MLIYPDESGTALRGDLLVRTVLRSDATPVPATVEVEFRRSTETDAAFAEGKTIRVGPDEIEFQLIKVIESQAVGAIQGDRLLTTSKAVGLLKSCAAIARPIQRAVIREGASLGGIYRACGAQVRIDNDFSVPSFSCLFGMTPSFEVAKVLQEEAGILILSKGGIQFRRLLELVATAADHVINEDAAHLLESDFLERHSIPFAISTAVDGSQVIGRSEAGRSATYRPRADQRIVNNMSTALVQRSKVKSMLSPTLNAGARVDIGSKRNIVVTAAHVCDYQPGGEQFSQFWLGEVVQ